jgi:4-alpha-glucanotransferase
VLSLDTSARFNSPGVADGNWGWRMGPRVLREIDEETGRLRGLVRIFDR